MVTAEEIFGAHAGKVWEVLKNNGSMTAAKIGELADLEDREVRGALGWLGREGKLIIEKAKNNHVYGLIE